MPLYRQRHVEIGPDGREVVCWRYTDRQRRVAAKPQPPQERAQARSQPPPAPPPVETVETTALSSTPVGIDETPGAVVGGAPQTNIDNEREKLMADLARQVSEFGDRIAKLEARTEDVATWGAEKFGDVRERFDAMARTVAKIETHDQRHSERLSRLEANMAANDDRLERIEGALGTLAEAAEAVAQRASS